MSSNEPITLTRDCEAIEIPSGNRSTLRAGTQVRVMQTLGESYTVSGLYGAMYRIDAKDSDALGLKSSAPAKPAPNVEGTLDEQMVWDQLKTVFDPEIPVNIVDLGLVYSCQISPLPAGGHRIDVKMSMTAPGCGMGNVLKADAESKISLLPDIKEVHVEIVFDPPWNPGMMSEAAKLQLGFDSDYGASDPPLPIIKS